MCGLVGVSGLADDLHLRTALRAIAHRGPDDMAVFENRPSGVALGHARLSIIDLSPLGHQPMASPDAQVVIAFNGEIFNYLELRAQLQAAGHRFRGHSDTEVLLHLYLAQGERLLPMLNGMFAFAIWDARRRAILLARDEMGVKPLYYAPADRSLFFASELKALLAFPQVPRALDAAAIRDHLSYLWAPAPRTLLSGVRKLEPGHAMWVRDGAVERHWRWAEHLAAQPLRQMSPSQAVEAVRESVQQAVRRQLVSDVPLGAFLSGGLDSSAVVAFARHALPDARLQCFTIAMDARAQQQEGLVSDLPYARQVARHLGVDLHEVQAHPSLADELPRMVWHLDEPQADPAPLNVLAIARLAREHGIKVLLSGAGGDDIFTGYRRHYALQAGRHLAYLPQSVRRAIAAAARRLPTENVLTRRLRKGLENADLSGDMRIASLFEWLSSDWVDRLLSPEFRAASRHPNPLIASMADLPRSVPDLNRMLHLECRHFLADHNLNYTDKMSMAAGVEVRVPLLDKDLVRLAFSLPLEVKQRGRQSKWVLSEAMRGILPDAVLNRPKTGFALPLRSWLKGPLQTLMRDTMSAEAIRRRGIFDAAGVQQLMDADAAGRVDGAYALLAVLCTELWCTAFIDGHQPVAVT
jgi:asparagine synthase (glutamine-hydrolysing)